MEKWEHKVYRLLVDRDLDQDLDWFGRQGWELVSADGANHYFRKGSKAMEKWEYTVYKWRAGANLEQDLDRLGQQGWELVSVNGVQHYFKRRLPQ